jgi:hypothetical protein
MLRAFLRSNLSFARLAARVEYRVVGESFYQRALAIVADGKEFPEDFDSHLHVDVACARAANAKFEWIECWYTTPSVAIPVSEC